MSVVGIGLGHATRSNSIYNKLKGKAKLKIISYGEGYNYFKKLKIPSYDIGSYPYLGEEFSFNILLQLMDFLKSPNKLKADYLKFRKYADNFGPDAVFSDSEPNAFFYAIRRRIPNFVLTNLVTTLNNYNLIPKEFRTKKVALQRVFLRRLIDFMLKHGDKFFVPSFEKKVKYTEKVEYTDLIVRKTPSQLDSENKLREKLGIDRDFYYVHVGGAEIEKYLFMVLENVLPHFKDEFFVISSNYVTKKIIKKDNMIIYPFVKNSLEFLKLSKGLISSAGHSSISESVVYKKPVLAVPVREHVEQLVNASILRKENFGDACFFEKRISARKLKESIKKFIVHRDSIEENLKYANFKGRGAKKIAHSLLSP